MKKVLATLLILVIVLSVMQLNVSIANPYTPLPSISFLSPYPSWDRCYPNASITIKIGIILRETSTPEAFTPKISYSLDNAENITLTNITKGEHWAKEYPLQPPVSFTGSTILYNLTEGNHTISAYSFDAQGKVLSTEREFIVDSFYKNPELTLIAPQKKNYTTSNVELIFSTNKEYKHARYILDYHLNSSAHYIHINGNSTLTNLTDGIHKIIVFADCYDEYHDGISEAQGTSFNVSISENTTETKNILPIDNEPSFLPVTAIIVIVVISSAMLSILLIKKKLSVLTFRLFVILQKQSP
jgi:hypothetical protein